MSTIAANILSNVAKTKQANVDDIVDVVGSNGASKVGAVLPDGTSGTTQQAIDALKANTFKKLANYTALRAYQGPETNVELIDLAGGIFNVDLADITSTDNGITVIIDGSNRRWKRQWTGPINVMWAGAKCDKVTDDTAAIQKVVDYCATFVDWPAIEIPGPSLLIGSLVVNREVILHTDRAEWRIYGTGGTGGLHRVDATTPMFTSTLPMVNDPLSAWITFIDMRFTSPNRALGVRVLSENFLQIKFLNCYFLKVRCGTSSKYWQSIYFDHCNMRYTSGVFLSAGTGFDVHYVGCISEYGESALNLFTTGLYGFSFTGGLHEGAIGGLLIAGGCSGVNISGNYFEYNDSAAIDLRAGAVNRGVSITGNFFSTAPTKLADTNFYEIMWGNTVEGVSSGNHNYNGRLHDNSAMPIGGLKSTGDYAALSVMKSPLLASSYSGAWVPVATGGAMTVVTATARREGGLCHVEFIVQFPAGGSANGCTISGLPYAAATGIIGGFAGYADLGGSVFLMGGSLAPNGTSTSFSVCKDRQGTRYTMAELNGVQIAGAFTYAIAGT